MIMIQMITMMLIVIMDLSDICDKSYDGEEENETLLE